MSKISSIEMNRMIRAVNEGKENPFPDRAECREFYDDIKREKLEKEKEWGELVIFSLVEPDEEEEAMFDALMPDDI